MSSSKPISSDSFNEKNDSPNAVLTSDTNTISFPEKIKYAFKIIKDLRLEDFKQVIQTPCARNALIYGISGGLGIGLLRFATLGTIISSSNYAVGSFTLISIASWEYCRWNERVEAKNLRLVIAKQENLPELASK